jgi:hypothetical protein
MFDNMGQAKNQKDVDAIIKRKPGNTVNPSASIGQLTTQADAGSMIQSKQGTGRT